MRIAIGIDLGSTTTKAVILDADSDDALVLGRGITNSRSNYDVACEVALAEAMVNARFGLIESALEQTSMSAVHRQETMGELARGFRRVQYEVQLEDLIDTIQRYLSEDAEAGLVHPGEVEAVEQVLVGLRGNSEELFSKGAKRKSEFFRDLAGSQYMRLAETHTRRSSCGGGGEGPRFDAIVGLYDKAILEVENHSVGDGGFERCITAAMKGLQEVPEQLGTALQHALGVELEQVASVGTGYGRARLPFDDASIRSEILCHGLGAFSMFPGTRTVLDIGGQDTKAIQVDGTGVVTSFQMNDRCAAGCGRYLGYIADEMNLGLHELGPLANQSTRPVRINSTCTVFAGAELRERLSLGEKREDILAGLHRAIILRAMSLLARSGGIKDEFTFTGGVASNPAAVAALATLVEENYGKVKMNISPSSIYTGALGAALFAARSAAESTSSQSGACQSNPSVQSSGV